MPNSACRGVRASRASSGRAGSLSYSQACIALGSCSNPLFPPCRLLQAFLSVPLQPALICAPSAPASASDPCPAALLVSPVPLVSLHHQDPLWLCSPASLTSLSTLRVPPHIFYLFFPHASSPPAEPRPSPGMTAVWASRPHCSCTRGRIPPSHLTGCRGACAGLGHRPQSSARCAAEPMPSISPSPSALLLQHLIPSSESPGHRRLLGSARA